MKKLIIFLVLIAGIFAAFTMDTPQNTTKVVSTVETWDAISWDDCQHPTVFVYKGLQTDTLSFDCQPCAVHVYNSMVDVLQSPQIDHSGLRILRSVEMTE